MSNNSAARYSRDGDQFHYFWAARRCLGLLSLTHGPVAITIEGTSPHETQTGESVEAGEEQIDVTEYYGSQQLRKATLIKYVQLKHSTKNPNKAWFPSELEKTIRGFAERYQELVGRFKEGGFRTPVEFCFVSNRPISSSLMEAVEDAESGNASRHSATLRKLEEFTALRGEDLSAFCKVLKLEGGLDNYRLQRADLVRETSGYLPGNDVDAPVQLKELVTRKALSESQTEPSITRTDVLRALGVTEEAVFPAPSRIASAEDAIPRSQEATLVAQIITATTPVIVHAEGGVGKSVFSQRIPANLPQNSQTVVYDCFGNGEYRRPESPRHRHKDALVQMANELATRGLCDPMIPASKADNADYLRAFAHRLKQSIATVRAENQQALLCIVVDAADNAEIAAREFGNERSFVRDLIRVTLPQGVRLIILCRTERQALLNPPPSLLCLELGPFSRTETALFLRKAYPDASDYDVDEFHRLTSCNPRVQATAVAPSAPLNEILRSLGPDPTTVADTVATLLTQAVDGLRENLGDEEQRHIESICSALATLRPFIPLEVLATVCGVEISAVKSFASDLGRPLLILEDAIQFRDEPVETWFREQFRPNCDQLSEFVERLKPFASQSAYVASTLPQLMLEAEQLSELIDLALSSSLLPSNPIERRDAELQRLQFALKASLRAGRFAEAAKLALRAAQETVGESRQQELIRDNTDLAAAFLEPGLIQEIVSRRTFLRLSNVAEEEGHDTWTGSHHVYEASLLSCFADFRGDARSRFRMAREWLTNWSRLPESERKRCKVTDRHIAEMALSAFNIGGPEAAAAELRRWKPREVSHRVGRIVARILVDHGRYDDLDKFAFAATKDVCLLLAINLELRNVHRYPPKETVARALRFILSTHVQTKEDNFGFTESVLESVTALVESAYFYRLRHGNVLAAILDRYLPEQPPRELSSGYGHVSFAFLRAYALEAALNNQDLQLIDLAHPQLREKLEREDTHDFSEELREFKVEVGALLPWHRLRADILVNTIDPSALPEAIAKAHRESSKAGDLILRARSGTANEIIEIRFQVMTGIAEIDETAVESFKSWVGDLSHPVYVPTWTSLARLAAHTPNLEYLACEFVQRGFELAKNSKEDAQTKAEMYVDLSRTILAVNPEEAREYFNEAIEVTSKIGDEILYRWSAMLELADQAADPASPCPETAYQLARRAELAYCYVHRDKHFLWDDTVKAITGLCHCSGFAILSRWRDRHFGDSGRLIAAATNFLLAGGLLDPKMAAVLVGFRAHWDYGFLVKRIFETYPSDADHDKALNFVLRYMRLEEQPPATWKCLKQVADAEGLTIPDIEQLIEHADSRWQAMHGNVDRGAYVAQDDESYWGDVFHDLELPTPSGQTLAYARYRSSDPLFPTDNFFAALFKRIPFGREAEAVQAFAEVPEFDGYHFRWFLEQLPSTWRTQLSVKSSIAKVTETLCRRHCMDISKNRLWQRGYGPVPIELASELCRRTSVDQFIDVVIASIGERTEMFNARRLFSLVGILSTKLSRDEALEVLNFGLSLLDDALDSDDGDGPWTTALAPPKDINSAIAGYIWAALAAPQPGLRWEAAHAVRGLCILGERHALHYLIELAQGETARSFIDSRLHFYHLHGRQWLMIALARAARDHSDILSPYGEFFVQYALNDEPHVVIRHFAAMAALALLEGGSLHIDSDVVTRLSSINESELPVISASRIHRPVFPQADGETRRFRFHHDMTWYWFNGLGDHFAKSVPEVELEMEKIICDQWRLSQNGYWDQDERHRRKIIRDRDAHHSHGSYPRVEDLSFYLSYHAMMTVAGKFLATVPRYQDPEGPNNEFEEWLGFHLLSRRDGLWLADRRDPAPLEWPSWKNQKQEEGWQWSVEGSDFDRFLDAGEDKLTLSGQWTMVSGRREETVSIRSALVTPGRSLALLKALQTAPDLHAFRIPDAGDHAEIREWGFELQGWVENGDFSVGRDEPDPWAGGIPHPAPMPANFVRELLCLEADSESRVWQIEMAGIRKEVIWSQIWGDQDPDTQYYERTPEGGTRLHASRDFVAELIRQANRDLIVAVQIDRRLARLPYERSNDDDLRWVQPQCKFFLFRTDGGTYCI